MNRMILGGIVIATALAAASAASAQTSGREGSRGSLPDGEVDLDVEVPRRFPGNARAMPLPRLEIGDARALPFSDPTELERGFGTVTRRADGNVSRKDAAPEVLDALRRKRGDVSPNSAPLNEPDPLFSQDEEARAVVGTDDRVRVRNTAAYPFRSFGLLLSERGSCSATLIGPATVVTAAHCVYSHDDGGWVEESTFYPGANGEGNFPYRGYPFADMTILRGYIDQYRGYYGSVVPWDLAVIRLQDRAGDRLGTLGYGANSGRDFRAYNVGYPGDKPFATQWRDKCDVNRFEMEGTEYIHRCDTFAGSSGSSMYRYEKRGSTELRYVEGINVAEVDTGDTSTSFNIGVLFTGAYFDWINNLRR